MNLTRTIIFSSALALSSTLAIGAKTPENLAIAKQKVEQYYNSGQYFKQLSSVINRGRTYLQFRVNQNKRLKDPHKLAMVLDIDETSLSNYPDMKKLDFGGAHKTQTKDMRKGKDPAIVATRRLFNYAKRNDIAVFFVTGRHEKSRKITVKNLHQAGYRGWKKLYLEPNDYDKKSAVPFKSTIRQKIEKDGYDIALSVGDQFSDLRGGYADMTLKLPNPFYYLP